MDPLECAVATAKEAGLLLRERVGLPLEMREKAARGDLVTASDRASEALIVARLRAAFPSSTILAEERGTHPGTSDERWIVDPLDGTTNYAHDYPMYCVSIAYERAGEVVAAAVYAPALEELYAGERGSGATCNGKALRVSRTSCAAESLVCTGFKAADYERNGARFARLSHIAQGVRRDGAAALDLAFVAAGRFEAFWEFDLQAWDVAAGALLVREAGGRVTAIDGSRFVVAGGSILATNAYVHDEMRVALEV
ncbi:MAG: inositol monophosphatase [Candidatus Eremiobacteraeota bacterium]|nr:inositol monophosphatase [Candidatus Eremiobacteraeota bacterium]